MQRWLFRRELEALAGREVFYLDECGVEHRLHQEYGRAPRGERLYAEVAGSRRHRTIRCCSSIMCWRARIRLE